MTKNLPIEPKHEKLAKGTRVITGDLASLRRGMIEQFEAMAWSDFDAEEIVLPGIEMADIYTDKAGEEVLDQMYTFNDKKGRNLCLRPEGTATCQLIAQQYPNTKDIVVWYETRCWRYERPQAGRYREFTQLGLEVLNPRDRESEEGQALLEKVIQLGFEFVRDYASDAELVRGAKRGLAYYEGGEGWEVVVPSLGAQKQVLGGGSYAEGYGFAIGLDRLMLTNGVINE